MEVVTLVAATFALVFLRAIQSMNVIGGHYLAAAITPFGIAAAEVALILFVVHASWSAVPYVGIGGALGATAAMWTHRTLRRPR